MIPTKDDWITCKALVIKDEYNYVERVVNLLRSEIVGIGEAISSDKTLLILKSGSQLTITEPYVDFVIDFFTSKKQVINQ